MPSPNSSPNSSPSPILGVIGDIHESWKRLDRVCEALADEGPQAVLLVGDLAEARFRPRRASGVAPLSYEDALARVLATVRGLGVPVRWVPGNHDRPSPPGEGNLDGRIETVAGLRVGGIGGAGPARFGFPYEWDEEDIRRRSPLDCDLLLSHAPPRNTPLDRTSQGDHAGSDAIRQRAEAHRGLLVCGHIHESPGVCRIGDCLCFNAGALGAPFGGVLYGMIRWERTPSVELVDLQRGERRRLSPP